MIPAGVTDLPVELLCHIQRFLPLPDYIRFGAVCKSWRAAAEQKFLPPAPQPPWLMLLGQKSSGSTCTYLSVESGKIYEISSPIEDVNNRLAIGSTQGWLITMNSKSQLHLANPFTGSQILLPSITTLPGINVIRDPDGLITDFSFIPIVSATWDPDGQISNFSFVPTGQHRPIVEPLDRMHKFFRLSKLIVARDRTTHCDGLGGGGGYIVFGYLRCVHRLAFARAGDDRWTVLEAPIGSRPFVDVCSHDGLFYTMFGHDQESQGSGLLILGWDLSGGLPHFTDVSSNAPQVKRIFLQCGAVHKIEENVVFYLQLVSSGGELLIVLGRVHPPKRYPPPQRPRTVFQLYKMMMGVDGGHLGWKEVRSLGNNLLFLRCPFYGRGSLSISTLGLRGLKGNRICFVPRYMKYCYLDYDRVSNRPINSLMSMYNVEDETVEACFPSASRVFCVWIMPNPM